jgi:hypothetical protein
MAALFTKFDPRAFLDAERYAVEKSSGRAAELATLAALAGSETAFETQPVRDADVTRFDAPARLSAAKAAKPAKDGPLNPDRADWSAEDWRARFDERAGFLEHDGGLLRVQAEVQAFESCLVEWLNRNPSSSPAGRCAWCGKSETPGAMVLPFGAGEHHAWLHADCWPAWRQSRRAEASKALRTMGIASGDHDG